MYATTRVSRVRYSAEPAKHFLGSAPRPSRGDGSILWSSCSRSSSSRPFPDIVPCARAEHCQRASRNSPAIIRQSIKNSVGSSDNLTLPVGAVSPLTRIPDSTHARPCIEDGIACGIHRSRRGQSTSRGGSHPKETSSTARGGVTEGYRGQLHAPPPKGPSPGPGPAPHRRRCADQHEGLSLT